ncbi:MAG: hypothetical protein ACREIF_01380 [Chthoniobacterales bacterium]
MKWLLTLIFIVGSALAQVPSSTPGERSEQERSAQNDKTNANNPTRATVSPFVASSIQDQPTENKTAPSGKKPKCVWYKLIAPENIPNLILAIVGIFGIIIANRTLTAIKEQVSAERTSADAALKSAEIAEKSLLVLERARIYISSFTFVPLDSGHFRYLFKVTNNGHIPGTIYSRQMTYFPTEHPLPESPPAEGIAVTEELTVQAGQTIPFDSEETHPLPSKQRIYIVGLLFYRDDFGERETRFCAEYHRADGSATMISQRGYNTAT